VPFAAVPFAAVPFAAVPFVVEDATASVLSGGATVALGAVGASAGGVAGPPQAAVRAQTSGIIRTFIIVPHISQHIVRLPTITLFHIGTKIAFPVATGWLVESMKVLTQCTSTRDINSSDT
jgi:hypothetical protein